MLMGISDNTDQGKKKIDDKKMESKGKLIEAIIQVKLVTLSFARADRN